MWLTFLFHLQGETITTTDSFPHNIHVSNHLCLCAKLSQLRSSSTSAKDTKTLVHEISTIVGCQALAHDLSIVQAGTVGSSTIFPADTGWPCQQGDMWWLTWCIASRIGRLASRIRVWHWRHLALTHQSRPDPALRSQYARSDTITTTAPSVRTPLGHVSREEHLTAGGILQQSTIPQSRQWRQCLRTSDHRRSRHRDRVNGMCCNRYAERLGRAAHHLDLGPGEWRWFAEGGRDAAGGCRAVGWRGGRWDGWTGYDQAGAGRYRRPVVFNGGEVKVRHGLIE